MEKLAKFAMQYLTQKAMNNGAGTVQGQAPNHSAKSISQLFKGA